MASLDKLAQMDGWEVDEAEDGSIDLIVPAVMERRVSSTEHADKVGRSSNTVVGVLPSRTGRGDGSEPYTSHDTRSAIDGYVLQSRDLGKEVPLEARDGDGRECQEESDGVSRVEAFVASRDTRPGGGGGAVPNELRNAFPAARANFARGASGASTSQRQSQPCATRVSGTSPAFSRSSRRSTLVEDLLKKSFGTDVGGASGWSFSGGVGCMTDEGALVAKLQKSLQRAQEDVTLERERCGMLEEQARVAYASLKVESKRRHKAKRGGRKGTTAGAFTRNISSEANKSERKTRSLSLVRRETGPVRVANTTEVAGNGARIAVIADAAEAAREEAQSALDTVEGFAALNRKLVDELRAAVAARDDLIEDLTTERAFREQLERDVEELLESGLVAEMNEKQEEFEARCKKEHEETARVVAVHARMEEEYCIALKSSERERARLEEAVASLEETVEDERHAAAVRAKENEERATMGSEEVRSLRAGLLSRKKLRAQDGRPHQALAERAAGHGGSRGSSLRLGAVQKRTDAQKHPSPRVAAVHHHPFRKSDHPGERVPRTQPIGNLHQINKDNAHADDAGLPGTLGVPVAGKHSHPPPAKRGTGGGDGGGSSSANWDSSKGDGTLGHAVHASAVESVESFLGDFVPKVRAQPPPGAALLLSAAAASKEKGSGEEGRGGGDGDGGSTKKVSKWAAIGRAGKMSARATAVCAEEATKAAEAEALHRLRSLINSTARSLSASWFSLLTTVPATVAAARGTSRSGRGGDGGGGDGVADGSGNANDDATEGAGEKSGDITATVPAIIIRRLCQDCGIVRSNAGGPTLAHADMELQRNALGKGGRSFGHREYFKIIVALSRYRFAGEPKDEALGKLSRMLDQAQPESARPAPNARRRQGHGNIGGNTQRVEPLMAKLSPTNAENSINAIAKPASSPGETGQEDGLVGAERILERDRRALEAIFLHYSTGGLVNSAALASFCKDFELTPGLISRDDAHCIYVQLAYPNETMLTPKLLAAREGQQERRATGRMAGRHEQGGDGGGAAEGGLGLGVAQWMAWLGLAAVGCAWFDKQRGLYNTPEKKVLGLLQWMEGSAGKKRISSKRGATIVPAFHLLPLRATRR